jgi:hypothetical protein
MKADGYLPQSKPSTRNSPVNALMFMVSQMMAQMNVAALVQVVGVSVKTKTSPAGTVDVKCLVTQVDGDGKVIPNDVIYNIPFFRLQGGVNAVIVDPVVGDTGFCVFADRDSSLAKIAGTMSPPGSKRRFSFADGLYIGGWSVKVPPINYIIINNDGMELVSPVGIDAKTSKFTITGDLHIIGKVTGTDTATFAGDVEGAGTSLHTHVHSGVTSGGSNTGVPV